MGYQKPRSFDGVFPSPREYNGRMDFSNIIDESASRFPERVAISSGDHTLTFAELADRVARFAGGLASVGLAPGDRLATLVPTAIDLVTLLLAAARAELIAVPVPPRYSTPQIAYILTHSGARGLVATPQLLTKVPAEVRETLDFTILTEGESPAVTLADLESASPIAPVRTEPDPIGQLIYTSGTTSRPKGVAHSQRRMARRVELFVSELELTDRDSTLVSIDAGRPLILLGQILPMLRVGGRLDLLPGPDPLSFWTRCAAIRPTYLISPTGITFDLLDNPAAETTDHSALRFWITGGDKATPALHERMASVVGRPLLEMCGMTEAGFYAITPPCGPIKVGSIGLAMRGVAVRLTAPDGSDVPPGEVGHILVRTPDLMIGYWNNTLATHRVLRDGWLETGDLARCDEDGYLWFVGRDKDMISRGGLKVAPAMVEEVLVSHPAIESAAVVGQSDPRYGQVPFAFYQLQPGAVDPGAESLQKFVAARLDPGSVPVAFVAVSRWPMTGQAKLDRPRLQWMAEAGGRVV